MKFGQTNIKIYFTLVYIAPIMNRPRINHALYWEIREKDADSYSIFRLGVKREKEKEN